MAYGNAGGFKKLPPFDVGPREATLLITEVPRGGIDLDQPTIATDGVKPAKWAITVSAVDAAHQWQAGAPMTPVEPGTQLKWWATFKDVKALNELGADVGTKVKVSKSGIWLAEPGQGRAAAVAAQKQENASRPPRAQPAFSGHLVMETFFIAQGECLRRAALSLREAIGMGDQPGFSQAVATLANSAIITWEKLGAPDLGQRAAASEAAAEHNGSAAPGPAPDDDNDIPF